MCLPAVGRDTCTDVHIWWATALVFLGSPAPNRKTVRAWQTKARLFELASHQELPSGCWGQTKCFCVSSVGPLWASGCCSARHVLSWPLSILTHLYVMLWHLLSLLYVSPIYNNRFLPCEGMIRDAYTANTKHNSHDSELKSTVDWGQVEGVTSDCSRRVLKM